MALDSKTNGKILIPLFGGVDPLPGVHPHNRHAFADTLTMWLRTLVGQRSDVQRDLESVFKELAENLVFFKIKEDCTVLPCSLVGLWCATDTSVLTAHPNKDIGGASQPFSSFTPKPPKHGMDVVLGFMVAGVGFESMVLRRNEWGDLHVLGCPTFNGLSVPAGLVRELNVGGTIGRRNLVVHEVPDPLFYDEWTFSPQDGEHTLADPRLWNMVRRLGVTEDAFIRVWLTADCWDNGVPMDAYLHLEIGNPTAQHLELFAMQVEPKTPLVYYFHRMLSRFYWQQVQTRLVANAAQRLGLHFEVNANNNWLVGTDQWVWRFGNRGTVKVRFDGVKDNTLTWNTPTPYSRDVAESSETTSERMAQVAEIVANYYWQKHLQVLSC